MAMELERLEEEYYAAKDRLKRDEEIELMSLDPNRSAGMKLKDLAVNVGQVYSDVYMWRVFFGVFDKMVKGIFTHFPNNIFWDLDYLIVYALKESKLQADPEAFLHNYTDRLLVLLELFGYSGRIRFRYVHDFTYGFDWSRWVKYDTRNREQIAPFSMRYFDRTIDRGYELLELIEKNDKRYHRLESQRFRNPFSFSRDPAGEKRLMFWLSVNNGLPIEQWNVSAQLKPEIDYDAIRKKAVKKICSNI